MNISQKGLDLIKRFESLETAAYTCPAGIWTIGYGHTQGISQGQTCTAEQAEAWLRSDVQAAEHSVNSAVTVALAQGQFDALVSFVFNLGTGKLTSSSLLKKLNTGNYGAAAEEFDRWIYVNGIPSGGLIRRRAAEKALFLS